MQLEACWENGLSIEVKFQELHIAITPRTVTPHEEENLVASFRFL